MYLWRQNGPSHLPSATLPPIDVLLEAHLLVDLDLCLKIQQVLTQLYVLLC